ncbi:MAG: hypothetical protein CMM35_12640 [Rhodospirillaceae bacterium]|nr:hypothetical protein [Rhodospirillaceae bacterium]|tara:strand:+ start:314 stop:1507 length:1194 start_codon:yes stop_codon:yes gene_type:complete
MSEFPVPENESLRLATLSSYDVLDTAPEVSFDEITELAAEILQCPVSFIEFMDADRQWFKSKYGLPDDYVETPRDIAICNTVICQGDLLYVPDLSDDDRFKNNPLVESEPNIRFYAGAPLITPNGQAIGTICSVDFEKRDLSINQREALRKLSKQVMAQLELRRTLIEVNRLVEEQKELSQRVNLEKENVELLLSRVLPDEIAKELQDNERVEPKYIDECSILFTDFVGFTKLTETLSPKTLIDLLHQVFCQFDKICKKYEIEKIKTIGDSYMCVSGITKNKKEHTQRICLAACEMLEYLSKANAQRSKLKMPTWEMRLGIHTGPIICGVVGEDKFTFDVWGDSVNTASLMEQNGTPGKVNVSESAYFRVNKQFNCEERGEILTTKKGPLKMFYVNK